METWTREQGGAGFRASYYLPDTAASHSFGLALASCLRCGDFVALQGAMGSGKTFLAAAIAAGLGSRTRVSSPSFTLLVEHSCTQPSIPWLFHFDAWRLTTAAEWLELGFNDYLEEGRGVVLIEWPERVAAALPPPTLNLVFSPYFTLAGRRLELSHELDSTRSQQLATSLRPWEVA